MTCAGTGRGLGDADPDARVPGSAGKLYGGDPTAVATGRHPPQHPKDLAVQQLRWPGGRRRKIPTQVTLNFRDTDAQDSTDPKFSLFI